ncbi:hypothetical protein [Pseudonocardia sp. MH-G8]|uniref:hypothetical protein n=1 Tax=Pseudonocardia sp. MH-G8 TaxID=1854588 RepID=UPI000BA01576|nr:hypothetical protein [Pseudonocardia sp. MH-G8]OZM78246.1 hypothetical protein CFP66_31675 [Pseudonocardia sp. MH-G8]
MLPIGFRTARLAASVAVVAAAAGLAGACSPAAAPAPPAPPPPPPPPPAACLLDTAALAEATGLGWAPDPSTASDTRCVYDPSAAPGAEPAFVTVEVAPAADPDSALDTVTALCEDGSEVAAGDAGVVCRFQGGSVFAAAVRDGRLVTVAASAVPEGTTAARLVVAFDQQVAALRP